MNYWHLQMDKPWGREGNRIDSKLLLLEEIPIIATGDWEDIQCIYFKGEDNRGMKIGDIVLVREGGKPIALCEIISDSFEEKKLSEKYHHTYFRNVNILEWFKGEYKFPQPQGTVQRLLDKNTESWKFVNNWYKEYKKVNIMKNTIELLKYKKQIILQGPPGTGKTRLAKIMAEELILEKLSIEKIDKKFIQENVKKGLKLSTPDKIGKEEDLFVDSIVGETINLKISTGTSYSVTFDQVLKCITEPNDPNPRSYAKGIIHFLKCELAKAQRKLIQFHPAYSYEDFVRGITVEVNNGLPEYITKNKILGEFAQKANNNFLESQKAPEQLSEERWLSEEIKKFAETVEDDIVNQGSYILNESVSIFAVDDDCFRYAGNNWDLKNKYRMKFTDIIQAQINKVQDRQDLKKLRKTGIISGRSWQHSSYDLIVLNKFREYLGERKAPVQVESIQLENYVLIIDEINRANLPAVLGELIYALEYRNHPVESMYDLDGDNKLTLPPNLYIIGTMNTADRSVGHIDYAIRRRFAFVDVLPSIEPIRSAGKEYFKTVSSLFIKNYDQIDWSNPKLIESEHLASDFRPEDVWLGHSYFITKEKDENGKTLDENHQMSTKLKYEIVPILKEYLKDGILNKSAKPIIDGLS